MKNLKIKLGLFSLLAILAASVFMTSCEQDSIKPIQADIDLSKQEIPEEVYEQMRLLVNEEPDYSLIPQNVEIPELDEETILKLKTGENIESRGCLPYNELSYHPQIGLIKAFEYPVTWVWSYKYGDWIWLDNEAHLCCCWVLFHTYNPICGMSGWLFDNDESDGLIWNWMCKDGNTEGWDWHKTTMNCNNLSWVNPVPDSDWITSDFGCRSIDDGFHSGIDFGRKDNPLNGWHQVKAVKAGKVIYTDEDDFGDVVIDHGNYQTLYRHMDQVTVQVNDYVQTGKVIGSVGDKGADAPHLHFEYYEKEALLTNWLTHNDETAEDPSYQFCLIDEMSVQHVEVDGVDIPLAQFCQQFGVSR